MPFGLSFRDFGKLNYSGTHRLHLIGSRSSRSLFLIFYFTLSLHFTPGLQSAVCFLLLVCSLHFTLGLQSSFYTDRYLSM